MMKQGNNTSKKTKKNNMVIKIIKQKIIIMVIKIKIKINQQKKTLMELRLLHCNF